MSEATKIRTRFAPSPTGSLHIGGARTALFNYLFAKKHSGDFILRIEDTDVARSTEESYQGILRDLKWFHLNWDEGPDQDLHSFSGINVNRNIGKLNFFGPYRQSQRTNKYQDGIDLLQSKHLIYPCWCSEEELVAKRKAAQLSGKPPVYDRTCRLLTFEEKEKRGYSGQNPLCWRFDVEMALQKKSKTIVVHDLVRGDVEFDPSLIGDFVLLKSNRLPSYNFACVIDDHGMEISHVIRGDEHLTNTPRQLLLYEAMGWELPQFAHISMILAPDHTKLSKRHGTTAVTEFKDKGFLAPAILNYIALLGWSPKDNREIFLPEKEWKTIDEALDGLLANLAGAFSLEAVSKNPAVFDTPKLMWMNAQYIKLLSPEALEPLVSEIVPPSFDQNKLLAILKTQRQNFSALPEIAETIKTYYTENTPAPDEPAKEALTWAWAGDVIGALKQELSQLQTLTEEEVPKLMKRIQEKTGRKGKELYWPIRAAVTGKTHGPEFVHLFPILGKEALIQKLTMK